MWLFDFLILVVDKIVEANDIWQVVLQATVECTRKCIGSWQKMQHRLQSANCKHEIHEKTARKFRVFRGKIWHPEYNTKKQTTLPSSGSSEISFLADETRND